MASRCWYLSRVSESCAATCAARRLRFSWAVLGQSAPVLTFLLGRPLTNARTPWGPLECFMRSQNVVYAAREGLGDVGLRDTGDPREWTHPGCELACPCEPPAYARETGLGSSDDYIVGYRQQLTAALATLLVPATLPVSTDGVGGPWRVRMLRESRAIKFAAFGVHLTTLLEPITAFQRVLPSTFRINAVFYGTSHPPPQFLITEVCPDHDDSEPPALRCFVSNWPPDDAWMKLYDRPKLRDALDRLVEIVENDAFIRQADCIVCGGGHSPTLCLLLRMVTSTPMYFTLQAPISFRMPQDPDQRALLVALFREMTRPNLAAPSESAQGRTVVTTSLIFFQRQVWVQTGCLLPIVRNHNLYVEAGLAGATPGTADPKEVVFWQNHVSLKADCSMTLWRFMKQRVLDDFPFNIVFKNVRRLPGSKSGRKVYALKAHETLMLSFRDLHQRFAAAVLFPHDVGTISFDDLYALSIPLFLPETKLVASMAYAHISSTQNYPWYMLRGEHANLKAARADRDMPLPWDPGWGGRDAVNSTGRETYIGQAMDLQHVEIAVATANYALFPHVRRFGSLAALLRDLSGLQPGELAATAAAMRRSAAKAWETTAELYQRAALHLLGGPETPADGAQGGRTAAG